MTDFSKTTNPETTSMINQSYPTQNTLAAGYAVGGTLLNPMPEGADLSPIHQAMNRLSEAVQQAYRLQEALEQRLNTMYVPYPVRDIRCQDTDVKRSATEQPSRPQCAHESMLSDINALVTNLGERQEALLKALQV